MADKIEKMSTGRVSVPNSSVVTDELSNSTIAIVELQKQTVERHFICMADEMPEHVFADNSDFGELE